MNFKNSTFVTNSSLGEICEYFYLDHCIIKRSISHEDEGEQTIIENIGDDFFVIIDKFDFTHILCQKLNGDLVYLKSSDNIWQKQIILCSKKSEFYSKNLFLISCDNTVHFFYTLASNDKWIAVNQYINNNILSEPIVIDYVSNCDNPYSIDKDNDENIYIFYSPPYKDSITIGYKKLENSSFKLSRFIELDSSSANISIPFVLIDDCNFIHLAWIKQKNEQYKIIYKKIIPFDSFNSSFNEVILNTSQKCYENYYLVKVDQNLWIVWKCEEKIYICSCIDNNYLWNKPLEYNLTTDCDLQNFNYSSNYSLDIQRIKVKNSLGILKSNLHLLIISELLDCSNNIDEIAATSESTINDFGIFFENIKNYFYKTIEKINDVEQKKVSLEQRCEKSKKLNSQLQSELENLNLSFNKTSIENKHLLNKIETLNNLISEKDNIIFELKEKIEELEKIANIPSNKKNFNLFSYLKSILSSSNK